MSKLNTKLATTNSWLPNSIKPIERFSSVPSLVLMENSLIAVEEFTSTEAEIILLSMWASVLEGICTIKDSKIARLNTPKIYFFNARTFLTHNRSIGHYIRLSLF
ncbi:hypothetical protein AZF04_00715 [Alkalihalobacillus trypoxylicola]|uniref:Uncharacterized protein n=1 Tax=Alkalihalobacillus trypoxylicola TaxID=519424 RepID=A0A161QAN4_9BACI|nr:hypothetical protein AZF04_00715 [Alkalihalobacillus trypoxylicola]